MSVMEYHYQTMGRVLVYLVSRGLARVDFEESDAMEIMTERWGDEEEVLQAFADCLKWMLAEGLIRAENVTEYEGGYLFSGVQLTSAGIAVIRRNPQDPDIGPSIEDRVSRNADSPMEASVYTKIGEFVGSALGGLAKSLSGGG